MASLPIVIEEYSPLWAKKFNDLHAIYTQQLGSLILGIEHVGSTSVPGLAAKPILDIDIIIDHPGLLGAVIERLTPLGYLHRGNLGITARDAFGRISEYVPILENSKREWMKHNLYVCPKDSISLHNHRILRDYLRAHRGAAAEYGALKRRLAAEHPYNIDLYIERKTPFIIHLLELSGFDSMATQAIISENRVK